MVAAGCAALLAWLLYSSLFVGRAQSIDASLYAQGLQSLARHQPAAELLGRHPMHVHGHWFLYPMAFLCAAFHPLAVLIGVQALSYGAVCYLAVRLERSRVRITAAAVVLVLSPVVSNPFVFDVRPGLVGVPFLLAALQRMMRIGNADARTLLLLCLASAAREEFAAVAAASILLLAQPPLALRLRKAVPYFLYFVAYTAFSRVAARGEALDSLELHSGGAGLDWMTFVGAKITLSGAWLFSLGGLWLLASRKTLALCLCSLLPALLSLWMLESQVRFHYAMFGIAPMIVAAQQGWHADPEPTLRRLGAVVLAVVTGFAFFSALPGGGEHRAECFNLFRADSSAEEVHAYLRDVDREQQLVVPFEYAPPLADRLQTQSTYAWARGEGELSHPPQVFVVPDRESDSTAAYLSRRGFVVEKRFFDAVVMRGDRPLQ